MPTLPKNVSVRIVSNKFDLVSESRFNYAPYPEVIVALFKERFNEALNSSIFSTEVKDLPFTISINVEVTYE